MTIELKLYRIIELRGVWLLIGTKNNASIYIEKGKFVPFAALTGHSAAISETARLTEKAIELSKSECEVLNRKITLRLVHLDEHPYVCITYFVPDPQKEVGIFSIYSGSIKSWDEYEQSITFDDNTQVKANEIIDIEGDLFDNRAY